MMALTTPFSPDTKQFEARQEDIYENASFRHHMPLGAGVGISFALGEKLALESGLNYTLLWSELTPEGGNVRQNQYIHYLGIPLQLDWIFFDRAGFRLYSGIGARMDICAGARIDGVKVKEDPLQWSASATVGAGYNFNRHVGIYLLLELDFYLSGTRLNSVRKDGGVNVTLRAGLADFAVGKTIFEKEAHNESSDSAAHWLILVLVYFFTGTIRSVQILFNFCPEVVLLAGIAAKHSRIECKTFWRYGLPLYSQCSETQPAK